MLLSECMLPTGLDGSLCANIHPTGFGGAVCVYRSLCTPRISDLHCVYPVIFLMYVTAFYAFFILQFNI